MRSALMWLRLLLLFFTSKQVNGFAGVAKTKQVTPLHIVTKFARQANKDDKPFKTKTKLPHKIQNLHCTIVNVPQSVFGKNGVQYQQKAASFTHTINPRDELSQWQYGSDMAELVSDVSLNVGSASSVSPETVIVPWNVTWTPPNAAWLYALGRAWPGISLLPTSYTDKAYEVNTFSWSAIFMLFATAIREGTLRVPLACIQGKSYLQFSDYVENVDNENTWKLVSISEELAFAQDLQQGKLQNRKCASDLRLFLELGRKPPETIISWQEWEDVVATCLPWSTVPGMGPLDLDPMAADVENKGGVDASVVFLSFAAIIMWVFAAVLAPELIGS